MSIPFLIIAMAVLTLASAYFSASETALFSLSSMKIKTFQRSQERKSRMISELVFRPKDLLVTILMMNVLVNILVQNIASNLFAPFSSWTLSVGVPLVLTLVFGEIIPKSLAIQNNEWIARFVAPVIHLLMRVSHPFRIVLTALTSNISQVLFFFLKSPPKISREELLAILKPSEQQGLLEKDEYRLIRGYLNLQNSFVRQHMRPKDEILAFNIQEEIPKLLDLFVEEEVSRIPVCDGELNKVLGIVTAKEFLLHREEIRKASELIPYLEKPLFVPESSSAHNLLQRFENSPSELALVVDEYGEVTGLVTREDLIEVVVGEIEDRRDEKGGYTFAGENVIIASGKLELSDFKEIFGIELPTEHKMVTLGGWLTEQMGTIPKSGFSFTHSGFFFHVLSSEPNRVRRVYVRKIEGDEKGDLHG